MNQTNDLIEQAWNHQRMGHYDQALSGFQQAVRANPSDIDAVYGLALAQKTTGRSEDAVETFNDALKLLTETQNRLMQQENWDKDNIRTPEEDRYIMLIRMVKQRLAELALKT
jgi:tetratricopeptide (TPR) repeat protein